MRRLKDTMHGATFVVELVVRGKRLSVDAVNHLILRGAEQEGRWDVVGDDPFFLLGWGSQRLLPRGLYCLSFRDLNLDRTSLCAKLYIDTGAGFNEVGAKKINFYRKESGAMGAFFWLNEGASALRLDPDGAMPHLAMTNFMLRKWTIYSLFLRGVVRAGRDVVRSPHASLTLLRRIIEHLWRDPRSIVLYAERLRNLGALNLIDVSRSSQPNVELPLQSDGAATLIGLKIAIHAHVFYIDLIDEVFECLANIPAPVDVFISTKDEKTRELIVTRLRNLPNLLSLDVRVVDNFGRDLAPMLLTFGRDLAAYDFVAHFHTKKSPHNVNLRGWRRYLLGMAFGSQERVKSILTYLQRETRVGLLFPVTYRPVQQFMNIGGNSAKVGELIRKLSHDSELLGFREDFFPSGCVFWCRGRVVSRLLSLGLDADDFDSEQGQTDGTLAHALERILPSAAEAAGFTSQHYVFKGMRAGESGHDEIPAEIDFLIFDHDFGGGTAEYRDELINQYVSQQKQGLRIYYSLSNESFECYVLDRIGGAFLSFQNLNELYFAFKRKPLVKEIVINSLIGFPSLDDVVDFVKSVREGGGTYVRLNHHDFFSICPSQHLVNNESRFCGVPQDLVKCNDCLKQNPSAWHLGVGAHMRIESWRESFSRVRALVDREVVFHESGVELLGRVYRNVGNVDVIPHTRRVSLRAVNHRRSLSLHVGVIGSLTTAKGVDRVNELARFISKKRLGIPLTLVGRNIEPVESTIRVLGPYDRLSLPDLIESSGISVVFISSVIPETFSYVVSEVIEMGVPALAFDIGAQGQRVGQYRFGASVRLESPVEDVFSALKELHRFRYGFD